MKKLLSDWEWLSFRILVLGVTVFFWSYLTEIPGAAALFGDTQECYSWGNCHWEWGFRHYCYTTTFALLTLVQIVRILKWIDEKNKAGGFKVKI
jgi:hypothetical protein